MSFQGFGESAGKTIEKMMAICKDKHAFLRHCCVFVTNELKKDAALDQLSPEERANLIFYPLKIAAETREEAFVALAVDSIQRMLAHGLMDSSFVYRAPEVPQLPKKKTFFPFGGSDTPPSQTPKNEKEENVPLVQVVLGIICMNASLPSEEVQLLVVRALLTAVSTTRCEVHGSSLLLCIRTTCDIFLQARVVPAQTSAKAALSQMIGTVQLKLENEDVSISEDARQNELSTADDLDDANTTTSETLEGGAADRSDSIDFQSVNERDCFLILRSLCKLSSKNVDGMPFESVEMRSKVLSLTLLYNLVANMGPIFASRPSFSMAIHKYLCVSLLHNFMSSAAEVTKISANILLQLLLEHRAKMKSKIAVFFTNVLFPILESPNGSFAHRSAVLTLLEKVLSDGQAVADIFVNFDCALSTVNLYHQIIHRVAKVVQMSHVTPNWISPIQDASLKLQGAKAVTAHVGSLRRWINAQHQALAAAGDADRGDSNGREDDEALSAKATAEFERKLKGKKSFEALLEVFNKKKAKEGIALAIKMGLIREETPHEVAQFLLTKGLDKVRVGEYLAQNNAFAKETLKAFIYFNDFTGLEIDEAMRVFLGKFKIFGEAEVVDRTMETFAERYCEQNPDAFSSPGTAYILAFSIMMLNTDAHSIHVKSKMTLAEFLRNNRGIDDGRDLPESMMQNVYQRITTREIKLDGDNAAPQSESSSPVRGSVSATGNGGAAGGEAKKETELNTIFTSLEKKKQMSYKTETEQLMLQSMVLLTADADDAAVFNVASGTEVAAAMWEVSWTAILPALSVPMEESNDEEMIDCCLDGFDSAMSINCFFKLATERKAFISSLLAFTHLTSFREIAYKNVKSITTLIKIASREGNALESSWYEILRCISWLEKLHLLSDEQHTKGDAIAARAAETSSHRNSMSSRAAEHKKLERHNAEIIAHNINQVEVDRIFSRSGDLEGRAVVDLVEALCNVSAEELQEQPRPRTYSLQKLVEVAEINIGRLRYVWSQMWLHLSKHFISVGLDKQQLVAMFVVDSLRQLAMKFLQRDELGNFNFQRDFLKPFEVIATQTKRPEIHELIIASLGQMIEARAKNIMSGWKIVLNTLGRCGIDMHRGVVMAASGVLEKVTLTQMHLLGTPELLTELVNAWSMFGSNTVDTSLALRSIRFVKLFAIFAAHGIPIERLRKMVEAQQLHHEESEGEAVHELLTVETVIKELMSEPTAVGEVIAIRGADGSPYDFKLWLTIFAALSSLSGVPDVDTRTSAVEALFAIVRDHGRIFTPNDWQMILGGTIYPIFDNLLCDLSQLSEEASANELARNQHDAQLRLLTYTMRGTLHLVVQFYDILEPQVKDLMDAFFNCARRGDVQVVQLGFTMVRELIQTLDQKHFADEAMWSLLEARFSTLADQLAQQVQYTVQRPAGLELDAASNARAPLASLVALSSSIGEILSSVATVPVDITCTFTAILRRVFDLCTTILDMFGNGASTAAGTMTPDLCIALLLCEEAACEGYLDCFPNLTTEEERAHFYRSANRMLSRVLVCSSQQVGDEEGGGPSTEEYNMLAGVAVSIIGLGNELDDAQMFHAFLDACYDTICQLIPLCHVTINATTAKILLKARHTPREEEGL